MEKAYCETTSSAYNPQKTEGKIYKFWEKGGYFTPKIVRGKKPYVITLPPPNVTGELHLGHAMYTVEDILVRYHRMKGELSLWLPGFDHASIAVEYLVCKQLVKEGKTKQEIGRQEFLKKAEKFANESKKYIKAQLKSMGFSLDWTREAYTMDGIRVRAVNEAFKRLYKAGLIYQGKRIINWCPACRTAISDLENEYEEEKSKLYFLKYGPISIATTRPETMFADVAVAVHPQDIRYKNLVGKKIPLPLTKRKIPVIVDEVIDRKFGTGALKVTPGHDELDFEIGQRHHLPIITTIGLDGKLNQNTPYPGLTVEQARKETIEDLKKGKFIEKIEDYTHAVGHCQRCGTITEPLISKQWFVKISPLAKPALMAVKSGEIKIVPRRFTKIYTQWLENIHDWCISRQLWWGHKIPIEGEEDVLDTWFSSGLWPFSVFGWPGTTETQKGKQKRGKLTDFDYFYPTTVRETGYDILFFWVAREIMLALFLTEKIPYETVYLHGLVRDKFGQKMSKTKGNILDPLDLTKKYGTDALRMALIIGNAPGNDLSLAEEKVKGYRNFCNKVWNAARFVLAPKHLRGGVTPAAHLGGELHPDDKWILEELEKTIKTATRHIESYRLGQAGEDLYHFFWHTFCDKYIEMSKKRRDEAQPTLLYVLETSLKLLHPFMPFITEEIWQIGRTYNRQHKQSLPLRGRTKFFKEEALIIAKWPK